jgi:GntR family transcriptional regulator of arabinose operon
VYFGNASDQTYVQSLMKADRIDGFLCANDHIAGHLMHSLIALGYDVPNDVRIVGVDDVKYAKLLPVPLTTQHQPCRDIGKEAIALMLNRIANPEMPPRDVLLDCHLVVRQSCGATVPTPAKRKMAGAARQP